MLSAFLRSNRLRLIALCQEKAAKRPGSAPTTLERKSAYPCSLTAHRDTRTRKSSTDSESVAGPLNPAATPVPSDLGRAAAKQAMSYRNAGYHRSGSSRVWCLCQQ